MLREISGVVIDQGSARRVTGFKRKTYDVTLRLQYGTRPRYYAERRPRPIEVSVDVLHGHSRSRNENNTHRDICP